MKSRITKNALSILVAYPMPFPNPNARSQNKSNILNKQTNKNQQPPPPPFNSLLFSLLSLTELLIRRKISKQSCRKKKETQQGTQIICKLGN